MYEANWSIIPFISRKNVFHKKNKGSTNKADLVEWDFPTYLYDIYCSATEQLVDGYLPRDSRAYEHAMNQ